jgi:hypothetical protein
MARKLLYLFLFLLGTSFYQGKVNAEKKYAFFCDTLAPTNVQVGSITLSSAIVSWTLDPNTPDYILRYRPVGSFSWFSTSLQTNSLGSYTLAGLMPCTSYEVQVSKVCNSVGNFSASVVFTTALNYCTSASVDSNVAYISNVTVNPVGLSQMVSNSGTSNYTDYRPDPNRKVNLLVGSANNTISVSKSWFGAPSVVSVRAWIDFNADGIFTSSEMILSSNSSILPTTVSTFAVPPIAFQTGLNCAVSMRVIISETFTSPVCGTFTYGEVEDYGVYLLTNTNLSTNETIKKKEINIYPNPVSDILNISGISTQNDFEIYNAIGQKVDEGKTKNKTVNVNRLMKGIYFIHLKEKENSIRLKFIKK